MYDPNRKTETLLSDYAEALRDGYVPVFLRSLMREEGRTIRASTPFWEATELVRVLNWIAFADRTATPDINLFICRVNARIKTRQKMERIPRRKSNSTARTTQ